MARRRGWGGDPPADDAQARRRIVETATSLIEQTGAAITLADVAAELGVIRQTIYRYFPTADALMGAAALRAADLLVEQLADRARGLADPEDAVIEVMASALEMVPANPQIGLMLAGPKASEHSSAVLQSVPFGRKMIGCLDVDWAGSGYTESDLDELVEFLLRLMQSFFVDPGPQRTPVQLRAYLRRWVGPAVSR